MSRNDLTTESASSRRAILKGVGAGATGLALGSGLTAARRADDGSAGGPSPADDGETMNCYTESRCLDENCDADSTGCQYQWRDCCNYGTGYQCENWNDGGCCNC